MDQVDLRSHAGLAESDRVSTLTFREVIDVRGRFAHIPRVYDA
jgi:hypothetical protein